MLYLGSPNTEPTLVPYVDGTVWPNPATVYIANWVWCVRQVFMRLFIFTSPSSRAWYDTRSIFKQSLTGFNSEFSFSYTSCLNKAEEPSLSYYLPIAGGRIIGVIPFPRVLVLCEMQSFSYRIWTRVTVSISYDDNHYTTGTSQKTIINCCSLQCGVLDKPYLVTFSFSDELSNIVKSSIFRLQALSYDLLFRTQVPRMMLSNIHKRGVSPWHSTWLWHRNKRVQTPVALLYLLSNLYSWER